LEFWLSFIEKFFVSVFCAYPKLFGDSLNIGRMIQIHCLYTESFRLIAIIKNILWVSTMSIRNGLSCISIPGRVNFFNQNA